MKKIIFVFLIIMQISVFSQKLKTDKFIISFEKIEKKEMAFCGNPQNIYEGLIKMKIKGDTTMIYKFFFPIVGTANAYLTIKNGDGIIEPIMYFNEDENSFLIFKGTDKEKKYFINREKSMEELILEAVEIWYQVQIDDANNPKE